MKKLTQARIKTEEFGFNNMPERRQIVNILKKHFGDNFNFIDMPEQKYWQNENDTLVISVDVNKVWRMGENEVAKFGLAMAQAQNELACDEFMAEKVGENLVIRIWWD